MEDKPDYKVSIAEIPLELLVAKINLAHAEASAYAGKAIERALEAGDLLIQAKASVAHGEWQFWLRQHCPSISPRTVQNYMRIARELPAEKRTDAFLTVNGALKILERPPRSEPEFNSLPRLGERAVLSDEWDWFISEASQHPRYYWLARFLRSESGEGMSEIFRRPMSASGISLFLERNHVLNKNWLLENDSGAIECFGQIEGKRFRGEYLQRMDKKIPPSGEMI